MKRFIQIAFDSMREAWRSWVYRNYHRCIHIEELPERLQESRLYVIGTDKPWCAALLCPCGCGDVIQLSLLPTDSPSWKISYDRVGLPTLSPSVWRTRGCRSHFFLRRGLIVWYRSEDDLLKRGSFHAFL